MNMLYEKARGFICRNARPLDFARFRFHFEGGSAQEVLLILSAYQNEDGGFGHALEPDFYNPASTPIATWAAAGILREVGLTDPAHPVIAGILRYLDSGSDFANGKWMNTVPSNNDYPHAVWWACGNACGEPDDNPTVSLAGFALRFAAPDSALSQKAQAIAAQAVASFLASPTQEMHTLTCYAELLGYLESAAPVPAIDLPAFREALHRAVDTAICKEPEKWLTAYVCRPSRFLFKLPDFFSVVSPALCAEEAKLLIRQQQPDGAWPITWQWYTPYTEFYVSANWWRASMTLDNLRFLRAAGMMEPG